MKSEKNWELQAAEISEISHGKTRLPVHCLQSKAIRTNQYRAVRQQQRVTDTSSTGPWGLVCVPLVFGSGVLLSGFCYGFFLTFHAVNRHHSHDAHAAVCCDSDSFCPTSLETPPWCDALP